ncbi:uncharacterized protein MONOS_17326 [Monocercomonoides exilis]|uniref:uncharacterized protein n=1 Tax=Monocercomonoides exilis TaxID=2049356 RepID=UPI00355991F7|nr:hypothetical protein MONOS_17326 [Monocercomonoides exilis]
MSNKRIIAPHFHYLKIKFESDKGSTKVNDSSEALGRIKLILATFLGETGKSSVIWNLIYFDNSSQTAIIRCTKRSTSLLHSALTMCPVTLNIGKETELSYVSVVSSSPFLLQLC